MKIEIDINKMKESGKGVVVCMPCYGGMTTALTTKSLIDLNALYMQYQIPIKFSFLMNESLISRARNYLCDEFLRSEPQFEYMMFIDADIAFSAQDILLMQSLDKDIICASYPKKVFKFTNMIEAVKRNPNISPEEVEKLGGDYAFNAIGGTQQFNVSELTPIAEAATGFVMIKRQVFLDIINAHPEWKYPPDHVGTANFGPDKRIHAFFQDGLFPNYSERFLSEDYFFSHVARELGYTIWMCPFVLLNHVGSTQFVGNLPAIAANLGHL